MRAKSRVGSDGRLVDRSLVRQLGDQRRAHIPAGLTAFRRRAINDPVGGGALVRSSCSYLVAGKKLFRTPKSLAVRNILILLRKVGCGGWI